MRNWSKMGYLRHNSGTMSVSWNLVMLGKNTFATFAAFISYDFKMFLLDRGTVTITHIRRQYLH